MAPCTFAEKKDFIKYITCFCFLIYTHCLKIFDKKYNVDVLKCISTEIHKGDVVVVIGSPGYGKSIYLRTLNLLEDPTGGSIYFEGVNITDTKVNINVHCQKMGMVFQQFNLFPHMTILKNMTIAPMKLLKKSKEDAEKKARELLKRIGLEDRENAP